MDDCMQASKLAKKQEKGDRYVPPSSACIPRWRDGGPGEGTVRPKTTPPRPRHEASRKVEGLRIEFILQCQVPSPFFIPRPYSCAQVIHGSAG